MTRGADLGSPIPRAPVGPAAAAGELPKVTIDVPFKDLRERWVDHLEAEYMKALIAKHGRNVGAIADAAELDRSYVHRLLRKHDL